MKRGQLLGIPFIYIIALVIAALILIFGIRLVFQLQDTASSVEVNNFVNNLRSETEKYSFLDSGSSKELNINLPSKVKQVCFKQTDINLNSLTQQEKSFMNSDNSNVFIIPLDSYTNTKFKIDNLIKPSGDPNNILCLNNPSNFIIESQSDYIKINP